MWIEWATFKNRIIFNAIETKESNRRENINVRILTYYSNARKLFIYISDVYTWVIFGLIRTNIKGIVQVIWPGIVCGSYAYSVCYLLWGAAGRTGQVLLCTGAGRKQTVFKKTPTETIQYPVKCTLHVQYSRRVILLWKQHFSFGTTFFFLSKSWTAVFLRTGLMIHSADLRLGVIRLFWREDNP